MLDISKTLYILNKERKTVLNSENIGHIRVIYKTALGRCPACILVIKRVLNLTYSNDLLKNKYSNQHLLFSEKK